MKINSLKNQIIDFNEKYRIGNAEISDIEYDFLLDDLKKMIPYSEYLDFTRSLHEEGGKVKHPMIMGSLNKIKYKDDNELKKFIDNYIPNMMHLSAKVDGISCRIRYKNGKLFGAYSRGNGEVGQDFSNKIFFVQRVPHEIGINTNSEFIDIRGELVIFKEDFENIKDAFKNPRNACAGIMNQKIIDKELLKHVSFISFELMDENITKAESFEILKNNGFTNTYYLTYKFGPISDAKHIADMLKKISVQEFPYETDGLVISDINYKREQKYYPDAQIAFKINELIGISRIIDINFVGPSKDGKFIPIAKIDPIELGGATITNVTCHNLDYIKSMDLKIGSEVEITKSGDIIPVFTALISNENAIKEISYITHCTECNSKLIIDGCDLRCDNLECGDKEIMAITNLVKGLGIEYAAKQSLVNWNITTFEKLLNFRPNSNYKSEMKFYNQLESKLFNQSPQTIFSNLNFRMLGKKSIDKLINFYGLDNLRKMDFGNEFPEGIGQTLIDRFCESSNNNFKILDMIMGDDRYSYNTQQEEKEEKIMNNGTVCFTGKIENMTRVEASKIAKERGWKVVDTINKDLDVLVCANPQSTSGKMKKARDYGVDIVTADMFFNNYC